MDSEFDERAEHAILPPAPYQVHGVVTNEPEQVGRLNLLIEEWLLEKYRQTRSKMTLETYRAALSQYRVALQQQGLDLDREDCLAQLVTTARLFASFSTRGRDVAVATSNLRLATLSSFYEFAIRNDLMSVNPIDKIKRGKSQRYQGAHAMEPEIVQARLRSIDASALDGKRDRALLLVYLQTCRRLSEVAGLLWRNVQIDSQKDTHGTARELVTLTFERCKGAKVMVDQLPAGISHVLLTWLRSYYGEELYLAPDTPLWIALAPGGATAGIAGTGSVPRRLQISARSTSAPRRCMPRAIPARSSGSRPEPACRRSRSSWGTTRWPRPITTSRSSCRSLICMPHG